MLIIGNYFQKTASGHSAWTSKQVLGADIDAIEMNVRLTKDGIPVLTQGFPQRKDTKPDFVSHHTLTDLNSTAREKGYEITTLEEAFKNMLGKIIVIVEIKNYRAITPTISLLKLRLKHQKDWESVMFSSFNPLILRKIRTKIPRAALALLHHRNPLNFIAWQIPLGLTAVGFHRLHLNGFGLKVAQKLGLFSYVYTVNRLGAADILNKKGYDAIVTDFPHQFASDLNKKRFHK